MRASSCRQGPRTEALGRSADMDAEKQIGGWFPVRDSLVFGRLVTYHGRGVDDVTFPQRQSGWQDITR